MKRELEIVGIKGEFELKLYGSNGLLKEFRHVKNTTVNIGYRQICEMMGNPSNRPLAFRYVGIGSGTVAPGSGDTLLGSEATRIAAYYTRDSDTQWREDCTFDAGVGIGAFTEAGVFNNATTNSETMLSRQTFATINKGASDTLSVRWTYVLT
jgi:hypothetical protein